MAGYARQAEAKRATANEKAAALRASGGRVSALLACTPSLFNGAKIAAVDKGVAVIDTVPDRFRGIQTLYLSKNALRSLEGVQQFGPSLRALSAADNLLADLHALEPLRGLGLVAASFEGNPVADLPLYRQHAISILGPGLQVLDSRAVGEEERHAAAAAVAHEDKLLQLMVANSCLVQKLGRCVQLVRLHTELQRAVRGGRFAAAAAGASDGSAIVPAGAGASRLLAAWDFEGSLGAADRRAIQLAIRREVARQQRRLVAGGARADASRTWQQAYAAVGLKQQEAIASLLALLEEAKAEAAKALAPLARPASPTKRALVQEAGEADARVRAEREALIEELRDAFVGLAAAAPAAAGGGAAGSQQTAEEYEGRIRLLHAALESAGCSPTASAAADPAAAVAGGAGESWEIPAVHASPAAAAMAAPAGSPAARPGLRSALKKPDTSRIPRRGASGSLPPSPLAAAAARQERQQQREKQEQPAALRQQQRTPQRPQQLGQQPESAARQRQQQQWQADDGLAAHEDAEAEEQQRCVTPRLFRGHGNTADSPGGPRPGSPSSRHVSGSPSWTPNPLARSCSAAMQEVLAQAEKAPGREQVRILRTAVMEFDAAAAQLSAANEDLAEALTRVQDHALTLQSQLAEAQEAAAARAGEHAAAEAALEAQLDEAAAGHVALRAQTEALAGERDAALAQRDAATARASALAAEKAAVVSELAALRGQIAELEARKQVDLRIAVSYEQDFQAQCLRSAALESSCVALRAALAAHERAARLQAASERMGGRVLLLRVLRRWRQAAERSGEERARALAADAFRDRRLAARWLSAWRLASTREKLVRARAEQRRRHLLQVVLSAWREMHSRLLLVQALAAAARLRGESSLLRRCFQGWREAAAAQRQVELAPDHPVMQRAALLQRRRQLSCGFAAWRAHMQAEVAPRAQAAQLLALRCLMGSKAAAWARWRQYVEQRRRKHMLSKVADLHMMAKWLELWRQGAEEERHERHEACRGELCHQVLLLRRAMRAWSAAIDRARCKAELQAAAEANHCGTLRAKAWQAWRCWLDLCRSLRQRQQARQADDAMRSWRAAVQAARTKRRVDALRQARLHRNFAAAFRAWRQRCADRRLARQRLAHGRRVLERRALERHLSAWRRSTLASKLARSLGMAQDLQAAVARVREELQRKVAEAADLEMIKVKVESQAEQLSVRVTCLDADVAVLQRRAAELEAALQEARSQAAAALAAQQQAEAARSEAVAAAERAEAARSAALAQAQQAVSQRDAAAAGQEEAEAQAAQACAARAAAGQLAAAAQDKAEQAEAARAAAEQRAAAAAAEQQRLQQEAAQLRAVRDELDAALSEARVEVARLSAEADSLESERESLRQQRDMAVLERTEAAGEAAGSRRQAERLAALCEEHEQRAQLLERQVAELQSLLGCQAELQQQVSTLARRNDALAAQADATRQQLEELTSLCERVQAEERVARQALSELRAEHACAVERAADEGQAMAERAAADRDALEGELASRQQALESLEARLAEAEAARDATAAAVEGLAADKRGLQEQAQQLRSQLERSNSVLESARRSLADSCARNEVDAAATASLQDLLQGLRTELLRKEEAVGRLTRQNEERCASLAALQQQLVALRAQVAGGGGSAGSAAAAFAPAVAPAGQLQQPFGLMAGRQVPGASSARGSPVSFGGQSVYSSPCDVPLAGSPISAAAALARSPQPPPQPPSDGRWQAEGSAPDPAAALRIALARRTASPAPAASPTSQGLHQLSAAAAAVPEELGQEVSFLLEMVVERRVTSGEAHAVISAAAGGDPAPLLSTIDAIRQQVQDRARSAASFPQRQQESFRVQQQQPVPAWQQQQQQQAGPPLSPATALELAAVRAEIGQLRGRS